MFKKLLFGIILCFSIASPKFIVSASYWLSNFTSSLERSATENVTEENNESNFVQQLDSINSDNRTETDVLFWTLPEMDSTLESDLQLQVETEASLKDEYETLNTTHNVTNNILIDQQLSKLTETDHINAENETNEVLFDVSNVSESKSDEKIVLNRNNCYFEIFVQENQDLKIDIEFQKLENNTSGKCCITLNGQMNSLLGVVISNVHLYQNALHGEVLQVIIADFGLEYVLKEYYSSSKYQPLLLTETHKVYIVLYYEVKSVPVKEQNSHFNLEVFSYHKNENFIPVGNNYYHFNSNNNGNNSSTFPFYN